VEFDLKKAFDTINRNKLINILSEDIADQGLMILINKMFNAKILKGSSLIDLSEGVPQGNILSPLLSNIYFSKLDDKVEFLINKYHKGEGATRNLEYLKEVTLTKEEREGRSPKQQNQLKKRKVLIARKKGLTPTIFDDKYCRVKYVRYADDFIIGVRGQKSVALQILTEVKTFLKSELHLSVNEEKTRITHVFSDKAHYLGMLIHCVPTNQVAYKRSAHVERFRRLKLRTVRKIEHAELKRKKILQAELMKMIKKNLTRKSELADQSKRLTVDLETLGMSEALKATNARGIQRRLAQELSRMTTHDEFPEFNKLIGELKA